MFICIYIYRERDIDIDMFHLPHGARTYMDSRGNFRAIELSRLEYLIF